MRRPLSILALCIAPLGAQAQSPAMNMGGMPQGMSMNGMAAGAAPGTAMAGMPSGAAPGQMPFAAPMAMSQPDPADEHAAAGHAGDPAHVDRTIDVAMDDTMRFTPDRITVKKGETIRFFIRNHGAMRHEMMIATMDELREHAVLMRKMPHMQHHAPNQISLGPGQRGGIVWTFDQRGTVDFACLVPGHMEAGMRGRIVVE